ncbi:MAG TPA: hypothetical protein VN922_05555 [Bacteroidia bacterium]|nr:hypothetical protein [Bacteroidia bacterium]
MKELKIKQGGILHRLAKLGMFPKSGEVWDREANVHNKLLRKKRDLGELTYTEYYSNQRPSFKQADFCHFVRATILGMIVALFFVSLAIPVITAYGEMFVWLYHCIKAAKWLVLQGPATLAVVITLAAFIIIVGILVIWGGQEGLKWYANRPTKASNWEDRAQAEAARLAAKLNRMEVRKAFWASLKQKTCFKMNIE